MSRYPWFKFYPSDWRAEPSLRMVSLEARGLWIECLCIMHEAEPYGHLMVRGVALEVSALAAITGASEQIVRSCLHELEDSGVLSTNRTGCVYSRRMVRDAAKRKLARENGLRGGDPDLVRLREKSGETRIASRFNRKNNPTKVALVWEACGGACSLCGVSMQFEHDNSPTSFEIDHITPLSVGGTNDLENLRGVCKSCNLKEAKKSGRQLVLVSGGATPTPIPTPKLRGQKLESRRDANASVERVFDALWTEWPSVARKRHPQQRVRDAIATVLKGGADPDQLIAAGRAHVRERVAEKGPEIVKGLVPWLITGLWRNWAEGVDYAEALRIWASSDRTFWDRAKYGPAPSEDGYRGPDPATVKLEASL